MSKTQPTPAADKPRQIIAPPGAVAGELLAIAPGYAKLSAEASAAMFPSRPDRGAGRRPHRAAVVELVGELHKEYMLAVRAAVNDLAANTQVSEIVLLIDSPGGSVSGTADLAAAVARAALSKRVTCFIEDMGASGAYWIASGATKIFTNSTGLVGSIGVYNLVADDSRFWTATGVDWILVTTGKVKGAIVPGVKITDDAIAALQQRVDAINAIFIAAIAKGRGISVERVRDLADGSVLVGHAALAAGLVDGITTFESLMLEVIERNYERYDNVRGEAALERYHEVLCAAANVDDVARVSEYKRAEVDLWYPELSAAARKADAERPESEDPVSRHYRESRAARP